MQEETTTQTGQITAQVTNQASAFPMKDLLIPISIIVAGALVGAGLYFGGQPAGGATQPVAATGENDSSASTQKVNPITEDDHIKGSMEAPIRVVEYSDFDCPFCGRFHDTMNEIVAESDGEVAWVYRQMPIEQLHPQAPAVALASECVAELGGNDAFWQFADGYFAARGAQEQISPQDLVARLVRETGVNQQAYETCFTEARYEDQIREDMADAAETGGRGTPWSILIGPSGKTYPINGALPKAAIEQLIQVAKDEA